jgi:sugar phosphate isomerase/epimerase
MFRISLDTVGYAGFFYDGPALSLEDALERAARFGFDALDVWPHRPVGFPMDVSKDRRKRLAERAGELGVSFGAIEAATDFRRSDHVLCPRQEKEILFVRDCCELARDLGCPVVRILAGYVGYFWHQGWNLGGANTAMWNTRSLEVSRAEDFLVEWQFAKAGIAEAARIAADHGVTLALQNHPPLTNSTAETLAMVDEIDHPNLKVTLDLPLFESQDDDVIRATVLEAGARMVHSHLIGMQFLGGLGNVYGFREVHPAQGRENWIAFFKACKEIGYSGTFAHEQCSPTFGPGHRRPTLADVDRNHAETVAWAKDVWARIDRGEL